MDASLTNLTGIRNFSSLTRNRGRQSITNVRRETDLAVHQSGDTDTNATTLQSQSQVAGARQAQFSTDSYTASGFNRQTRDQSLLVQPLSRDSQQGRRGRRLKDPDRPLPSISSAEELEGILKRIGETNKDLQSEFRTLDHLMVGLQEQLDNFDSDDYKDAFLDSTLVRIDSLIVNLERLLPRVGVRDQLVIELQNQLARYSQFSSKKPSDTTIDSQLTQSEGFLLSADRAEQAGVVQPKTVIGGTNSLALAVDATSTTITLNHSPTEFPNSGVAYIGNERISYTGKDNTNNQLTGVARGHGTRPSSHSASEQVMTEQQALTSSMAGTVNGASQENRMAASNELRLLDREFGDYRHIDALITDIGNYDPDQPKNQSKLDLDTLESRDKLVSRIGLVDRLLLELRDVPLTQPTPTDPLKKEPVVPTSLNLDHVLADDSILTYSESLGSRLGILDQQLEELSSITFPTAGEVPITFEGPDRRPAIDSSSRVQLGNPIGIRITQDSDIVEGAEFMQRRGGVHPFQIGAMRLGGGRTGGMVIERQPLASEGFQQFAKNNTGLLTNNYT